MAVVHTEQRVRKSNGTSTTTTPNKYYEISTSTSSIVKSIFTPDGELVATVKGSGATTTREYIHLDHLGGTNVVTNASSTVISTVSYYPYGQERINNGNDATDRHFIGQRTDESTLSYLQNRYYASNRGQFLNEDQVFWEIGRTSDGKKIMLDPQSANSYGYARDNPIIRKDPDGRNPLLIGAGLLAVGFGGTWYSDIRDNQRQGLTGINQLAPRDGFVNRGLSSSLDVAIGFIIKNPLFSGLYAGGTSLKDDRVNGKSLDYATALKRGLVATASDLLLGPLNDASQPLKRDLAKIFTSGILNLGGLQYIQNNSSGIVQRPSAGSLPSTVTQNGTTYYRTRDGLLSTSPQGK